MSGDTSDSPIVSVSDLREDGHEDFDPEDEDTYTFQTDFTATYKTYAKGLYDSPRDSIREIVSNSTAALERGIDSYSLTEQEAVIEITLDRDERMLSVRDNGDGITENDVERIMTKLNQSESFVNPDRAGQFGVGFLSTFMLVDLEGAFLMYSRPRAAPDTQLKGTWHGGRGFKTRSNLSGGLPEDEYGVVFHFPLAESIDMDDIEEWVEEVCSRCEWDVYYEETGEDGESVNEDYGSYDPTEKYTGDSPVVSIDNEYLEAYNSDNAEWEFTLINSPISFKRGKKQLSLPFDSADIRFKYESGVVVEGPNEGLIPVEFDYSSIPESERHLFIPESELSSDDIVMPKPTQGRSRLRENDEFVEWLEEKIWSEYERNLAEVLTDVESYSDLFDFTLNQLQLVFSAMSVNWSTNSSSRLDNTTALEARLNNAIDIEIDLSESVQEALVAFKKSVCVYQNDEDAPRNLPSSSGQYMSAYFPAYWAENTGGDIYMMVSKNEQKAGVIFEDNEDNIIVQLDKKDEYDLFEPYGWKKLKTVKSSTIESFDVSDETVAEWKSTNQTRKKVDDRDILIHFGSGQRHKHEWKTGELQQALLDIEANPDTSVAGLERLEGLVLFPSDTDKNLSNWYELANKKLGIATCINKTYQYLSETSELVHHIDEYVGKAESEQMLSSEGEVTIGDLETENLTLHIVPDSVVDSFRASSETASRAHDGLIQQTKERTGLAISSTFDEREDDVYIPLTADEYERIRPAVEGACLTTKFRYTDSSVDTHQVNTHTGPYAYAMLPEYEGTSVLDALVKTKAPLFPDGQALVHELKDDSD